MRIGYILSSLVLLHPANVQAMELKAFLQPPRLVLVLVIDQFRADYLTRYHSKFQAAGSDSNPGGFLYLLEKGAYFPFAEYDVLQNMTCPGHAMILTGTRPALNGIALNDFYDRKTKKVSYCVQDELDGISPKRLLTTTVGDELRNISPDSKVVSVSLKDRAAVMLGGHNATSAVWFNAVAKEWVSSSYYSKAGAAWLKDFNASAKSRAGKGAAKDFLRSAESTRATVDAAMRAAEVFSLGADETPDILAVSLSSHDYLGHRVGPNSPLMLDMTLAEDAEISRLITALAKRAGGIENMVISLTADHGVAPPMEEARTARLNTGGFEYKALNKKINSALSAKFGAPKSQSWIAATESLHIYFEAKSLLERKISGKQAEQVAKEVLLKEPGVLGVLTRSEFLDGSYRNGPLAEEIARSYLPSVGGDVVILPQPYFMEDVGFQGNHDTNWAYDRTVPLVVVGKNIKPGVYSGAKVIDLAPTLSFLLGTLPPATNQGRALSEIFR